MAQPFAPLGGRSTIAGGSAATNTSRLSALAPANAGPPNRRLTTAPRVTLGANTLTNPPRQSLSASQITQRPETVARLSGEVAHFTETALQVADGVISQPITVADLAISLSYHHIKEGAAQTGLAATEGEPASKVGEAGAIAGLAFAGLDTALAVYSLGKAVRSKNQATAELARNQSGAKSFETTLERRTNDTRDLAAARASLAQVQNVQTEFQTQIENWQAQLDQLESEYRQLSPSSGETLNRGRTALLQGRTERLTQLKKDIEPLRAKLQDPEKSFLRERRDQIAQQPDSKPDAGSLDAFEHRDALAAQISKLETEQQTLTDELRGLAPSAHKHAIAQHALAEARRDTAETAVGVTRAGAGLVRSALEATHAGIALAGGTSGSGLVAASQIAGTVAGGLSIVAGGAMIGIAAYRMNKASQRREAIQGAISPANGQSNTEVLQNAARHATDRRSAQITTSKWNIFKGVLGVVGGSLAIATIAATGVGALALGIAALGIGVVAAATSIGTLYYGHRQGKADAALRAEVATEQARAQTLETHMQQAREEAVKNGVAPPPDELLEKQAHEALLARNPFYAIHVFVETLARSESDSDREAALQFLEQSGFTGTKLEQVRLLATEGISEENKQLLKQSIESHLFG